MPSKKTKRAKATRLAKVPQLQSPIQCLRLRLLAQFCDRRTIRRFADCSSKLKVPIMLLVDTGLESWLDAIERELAAGLTFPVQLQTVLPGDRVGG